MLDLVKYQQNMIKNDQEKPSENIGLGDSFKDKEPKTLNVSVKENKSMIQARENINNASKRKNKTLDVDDEKSLRDIFLRDFGEIGNPSVQEPVPNPKKAKRKKPKTKKTES